MTELSVRMRPAPSAASATSTTKVMVVDDSAVVRGLLARWLREVPEIEVVARHSNGKRAVDDIASSRPDVVILDIEMPVMDGLEALPQLIERHPGVRVIMASTLTRRNAEVSLRALSLGAADYIAKPDTRSGGTPSKDFCDELIKKIIALGGSTRSSSNNRRTPHNLAKSGSVPAAGAKAPIKLRPFSSRAPQILAIGSSTGGPQALIQTLRSARSAITRLPVVITQHMPATFTTILAEQLGRAAGVPAKEGENGEVLKPGTIYVAPGGYHMILRAAGETTLISLNQRPAVNFCRPAVDPLFESVAHIYRRASLAVVLTGMGVDGAAGAACIAEAGGSVIAQDEATSVVWGMPGATAAKGVSSAVLPLADIGPKICALLGGGA